MNKMSRREIVAWWMLFVGLVTCCGTQFTTSGCSARDRRVIKTVADIADASCADGDSPKECLSKMILSPKLSAAEAAHSANPALQVQVFCSASPAPAPAPSGSK